MPQEILDITDRFQQDPEFIKITPKELTIDRIEQYYYAVKSEYKTQAVLRLLAFHRYQKSIIFCNTKAMTDSLATELKAAGYSVDALHGDLGQKQRDVVMNNFRTGAVSVLIATDIAARGIDVDDVEAVFNYDIPSEIEYYVHRIGRTGRAGRTGVSHTLCKSRDFRKLHEIEEVCHTKMEERKIPSSASINEFKVRRALEEALVVAESGDSKRYNELVSEYCDTCDISAVDLAAAFLKLQIGEILEDITIDLPEKSKKKSRKPSSEKNEKTNAEKRDKKRDFKGSDRKEKKEPRRDSAGNIRKEKRFNVSTKTVKEQKSSDRKHQKSEFESSTKKVKDIKEVKVKRKSSAHHERLNMKGERIK
ncbi:MAG: hypothetical protein MJ107_06400 [Lachnospiraceae bacterium]|nr:hypothetical protein [Lachnospiraceae bacterium]